MNQWLQLAGNMITVEEAEKLIQREAVDYGNEIIPFELSLSRVLAEEIKAERDWPPFNRATMDGIAIKFEVLNKGINTFKIKATQAAGDIPVEIGEHNECVEIMTGAAIPVSTDTVIRYEDLEIESGTATITSSAISRIKKGQSIHQQGTDKKQGDVIAAPGQLITPAIISMIASVGETELRVKKMPRVVILSSGDELVKVNETPSPYQVRQSNSYMVKAVLNEAGLHPDVKHIPDDPEIIKKEIQNCLQNYDVMLLSGGISMGKFDYIPKVLEELEVKQLFYKVKQRPGKPFWFGKHESGVLVFAFPGNPVSVFMCVQRYFLPWLNKSLGMPVKPALYAILGSDFTFEPRLQYFLQVKLHSNEQGQLIAEPIAGNGSGDFANLADTDAFIELPLEKTIFSKGEAFRIWPYKQLF